MKYLNPALSSAKANVAELDRLRESQTQLQLRGIHPEVASANFPLLTAKMAPKEVSTLKKSFVRQGFVAEIDALEGEAKAFAAELSGKGAAAPSQAWKLLYSAKPESVLWVAHTTKNAPIQAKFKAFYSEWPQAKQKIPYALMQEMRIVPELPGYEDLTDKLFFELMDNKLGTVEEMKAYLEPFSPPAPPPPVHLRRPRAPKKDAKPPKSRKKAAAVEANGEEGAIIAPLAGAAPAVVPAKAVPVKAAPAKAPAKKVVPVKAAPAKKAVPAKVAAKKAPVKAAPAKHAPAKAAVAKKSAPAKVSAKKAVAKTVAKAVAKKVPAKAASKAPAKKTVAKTVAKKAPAKKPAPVKKVAAKTVPVKKGSKAAKKKSR
jgi:tRNA nucleotidyltransferase (CCA-adding enzyme)